MKKILFTLIITLTAVAQASAYDFEVNGVYYRVTGNHTVSVTYKDTNYNSYSGYVYAGGTVSFNGIDYDVTAIDSHAFQNCTGLRNIDITNSITSIGSYAFAGCTGLTKMELPHITSIADHTFDGCTGITDFDIHSTVTSYGSYAFRNCSNLLVFRIHDTVTSIGDYAFDGCSKLVMLTVGENLKTVGSNTFRNCNSLKTLVWTAKYCNSMGNLPADSINNLVITYGVMYLPPNFVKNSQITQVSIPASVINIGANAFQNCKQLTDVVLPNGLTSISNYLFDGCTSLASVNIPAGVTSIGQYAFSGCSALDGIVIPEGVTEIPNGCFNGCSSLTSINIPTGVTSIHTFNSDSHAFYGCNALTSLVWNARSCSSRGGMPTANIEQVTIGSEVTLLPDKFLDGSKITEVAIPASVSSIGSYAFRNCKQLTDVVLPNGLTSISNYLFDGCTSLASVNIPAGVTSIGQYAFSGCSALDGIVIPEGVTEIPSGCFNGCSSLTAINIPAGVTSIYTYNSSSHAFYGCNALTSLVWNARSCSSRGGMPTANIEQVTIGSEVTLLPDKFLDGSKITEVAIPASVTSIGSYAFRNCKQLVEVAIPDSVTKINNYLFAGCDSLVSVNIPVGVTSIGQYAFNGCKMLSSVVIPSGATEIGTYAFYNCTGLLQIICRAVVPPTVASDYTFRSCYSTAKLKVPRGVIEDYKAANYWKNFLTIVGDEYDFEVDGIYYVKTGENTASVTYKDTDYNTYSGTVSIPKQVDYEGVTYRVTGVSFEAFKDCPDLTKVTMSKRIQSIEYNAFENCTSLTRVTIPDNVTAIGANAFKGCTGLTDATIGSSVATIGSQAFDGCDALTTVMSRSVTPPALAGMSCFSCYETATLNVPIAAVEDYSSAYYWKEFMEIVGVEINAGPGDVDGDGNIGISDLTALIGYLLNGNDELFYAENADTDENGKIDIADVTDLINNILNGDDD